MIQLRAQALFFDLDGTLINSLPAVERAWKQFATRHSLDSGLVLETIHGRRSIDSIRKLLPHVDAAAEDAIIRQLECSDTEGVTTLPGVQAALSGLSGKRWALVTSGTSDVAMARCRAAGIPQAAAYVFGEDVVKGKPAPDPYRLAAEKLGVDPGQCLGFEDTAAGVTSILAAGMIPIGIGVDATYKIRDFRDVSISEVPEGFRIQLEAV